MQLGLVFGEQTGFAVHQQKVLDLLLVRGAAGATQ